MCEEQSVDDLNVDFRIQVEPRYNELLYHEDLGKRTIFFAPNNSKIKGREAQFKKKHRYSEDTLPVPWPFVISRFHCIKRVTILHVLNNLIIFCKN